MDLIDRQAAISDFEWCKSQAIDKDKWQEAIDRINALPSVDTDLSGFSDKLWKIAYERGKAEAVRWIPVSERLPDNDDKVLCCTITAKGMRNVIIGYYADRWCCGMNSNVIAWQPLPEPYKEGD